MTDSDYLIVGGGMAADAAVKGIREVDSGGSVLVVGAEPDPPYSRPPLSKKLWQGKPVDSIWRPTAAGAEVVTGRRVVSLDPERREVRDHLGTVYRYRKLLLATGGRPNRFIPGDDIIHFRTVADYRRLRELADGGGPIAVIGGGFIGSEIAASLAGIGTETTLLFPEEGICSRVFPSDLSRFLNSYYRERGVTVAAGEKVLGVEGVGTGLSVTVAGRPSLAVSGVVAGLGVTPEVELARQAGCTVNGGVEVDEFLQAAPGIYAAGDIASFVVPALGDRRRFEHEDNALAMGRQAGRNMAGAGEPYRHLPFFYSDLFDLGYEAVGELDSRLDTVSDWQEPFRKGVVYYLREGKVRGVLLWNVWDQVENARGIIAGGETVRPEDLRGRLPA